MLTTSPPLQVGRAMGRRDLGSEFRAESRNGFGKSLFEGGGDVSLDGGELVAEIGAKVVEGLILDVVDYGREGGNEVGVAFDRWKCGWLVVASSAVATATAAAFDGRRGRNSVGGNTILWSNEEFRWGIDCHACQWRPICIVKTQRASRRSAGGFGSERCKVALSGSGLVRLGVAWSIGGIL